MLEARDDQPARLVIDLVPTDEKTFLAKLKESRSAASSQRRAISPDASAVASGRREARGGVGPRPRRRRSGDEQRHRHHREGGRARLRPRSQSEARGDRALRGVSDPRGRYLPAAARARRVRPEERRGPLPLHPRRLFSQADRQGDRRYRLYVVGGSLGRRGEGARGQGEFLRRACWRRAAERFRRGGRQYSRSILPSARRRTAR